MYFKALRILSKQIFYIKIVDYTIIIKFVLQRIPKMPKKIKLDSYWRALPENGHKVSSKKPIVDSAKILG